MTCGIRRAVEARIRSAAYALFSQLTASPNRGVEALAVALPPVDLSAVLRHLEQALPYAIDFSGLARAAESLRVEDAWLLCEEYGRLFEVGSDGPPVPIREEWGRDHPLKAKEELVRFYDFFGYQLRQEYAWAPDHLSIELEFLHFLAHQEGRSAEVEEQLSYQLAQRDFLERHVLSWYDRVWEGVKTHSSSEYYRSLFETLGLFLRQDLAWQRET